MKRLIFNHFLVFLAVVSSLLFSSYSRAQAVDDDQMGAWYMYFFDGKLKDSKFGIQGDVQYRNWDFGGDLEQMLLRSGITYRPNENVKLTLGYGYITSGVFGDSDKTSAESRIYQEALLPQFVCKRLRLTHRFRYEQRFVDNQDFRTRYRYNLFVTIPLNADEMQKGTLYLSLYNELFINGQKDIGDGRTVELFDRNRFYITLGHQFSEKLKVQAGCMRQTNNVYSKNQIQVSLHHKF